ncbi:CD209 antigen-like protein C isoform X1 [Pseudorasbora parva]|uniref:CD209 antigen-like protein C isoform X1 n=1 Tax=Pseudorasbora parva TaxID=51549 RepID=UPI00351F0498
MEFNMQRKDGQTTDEIYEIPDVIEDRIGKEITMQGKSSEFTESDSARNRSSRAAAVCLGLLCVLLLTAVIVLCVMFTQERQQLISKNENLTNERDQLIFKNKNLINDRDQLISSLTSCSKWTFYQSSFYYISTEQKSWTESRRYCTERGADLIIINNKEEQDFVKNISNGISVWIGLTDSDVEGRWEWVDGSSLNSSFSKFWAIGEPNGGTSENCALSMDYDPRWLALFGWLDIPCNRAIQWICEKSISQLILPYRNITHLF